MNRNYDYLKKTLLVQEPMQLPNLVAYSAKLWYTPWMVYKYKGELLSKLNLFEVSIVKDKPFKITEEHAE